LPKSVGKKIPPPRGKREGRLKPKVVGELHETASLQRTAGRQHDSREDDDEKRDEREYFERRPNRLRFKCGSRGEFVGEKHLILQE